MIDSPTNEIMSKEIKVPIQHTFSTEKEVTENAWKEIVYQHPIREWKVVPAIYSEKSGVEGWVVVEIVED